MNSKLVYSMVPTQGPPPLTSKPTVVVSPNSAYYDNPQSELYRVMASSLPESQKIRIYEDLLKRILSKINGPKAGNNYVTSEEGTQTHANNGIQSYQNSELTSEMPSVGSSARSSQIHLDAMYNQSGDAPYDTPAETEQSDIFGSQLTFNQQSFPTEAWQAISTKPKPKRLSDKQFEFFHQIYDAIADECLVKNNAPGVGDVYPLNSKRIKTATIYKLENYFTGKSDKEPPGARAVLTSMAKKGIRPVQVKTVITNKHALSLLGKLFDTYDETAAAARKQLKKFQSGEGIKPKHWNGTWISWNTC